MAEDTSKKKRLNLLIDEELHKRLKLYAVEHNTSIVGFISEVLTKELDNIAKKEEKVDNE